MSVAGRHIVVSGGGSGVGAELARVFASKGGKVTILGRRKAPLEEVASQIGALPLTADVTDRGALEEALAEARERHGAVEIAIANAGQAPSEPFRRVSTETFSATLAVNLEGVFHLWQACHRDMTRSGWGRLVAVASTAGLKGYPYVAPYCAAKHGVIGLTRSLALELATTGVTVNAICPGFIDTPLLRASVERIAETTGAAPDKALESLQKINPQRRFVSVAEVAQTALWLCSAAAGAINGHALALSGGEV